MKKSSNRLPRVADLIQMTLAEILQRQASHLEIGMVTVTEVKLSPDFSFARVFVSVLEEEKAEATIDILNQASKNIRYTLAHTIKLRTTPDLKFIYDDSTLRGSRISTLINNALKQKS